MSGLPSSKMQLEIGRRLKTLREALDLSGATVGDTMGVAPNTVSSYETGRTKIDIVALARFLKEYGISADYVLFGTIGRLPVDVAARVQAATRSDMATPKKAGRPRRPQAPLVDEVPSIPPAPKTRVLHEPTGHYTAPRRKSHSV
jgi:transcriptional regulator with XRE-family HTH domain